MKTKTLKFSALLLSVLIFLSGCAVSRREVISLGDLPPFSGEPFVEINGGVPDFSKEELSREPFEHYSELDALGRCGVAECMLSPELMPNEERGAIGSVKPSGWQTVKYDCVDGKYLYNRCHLVGFQLAGENANEKNLITGTRYMNVEGMLPFENLVADYIKETGGRVLYRVTPVFEGDNLVASGVTIEAESADDEGGDIFFSVFVYNCQPGIIIDYKTGQSRLEGEQREDSENAKDFVVNLKSKKFHLPECSSVETIKPENRYDFHGTREKLESEGYEPCKACIG